MMPQSEQAEVFAQDNRTVLLLGAGIHQAATTKNKKGTSAAQKLASWAGVQEGSHDANLLGQTLAWELNALDGHDADDQAADRLTAQQKSLAEKLEALVKSAHHFGWQPPLALQILLQSEYVTDVVSLNVDLLLEQWIVKEHNLKTLPRVNGADNRSRRRAFQLSSREINFWYPHGDIDRFRSLQFSLSDYGSSLRWMEKARQNYKAREKSEEDNAFETWLDPFLSKRHILVLGASLDQAEWDIWYALLRRWRNFARYKTEEWYPKTWVLSKECEKKHSHLPQGYIELLERKSYPEAWETLKNSLPSLSC